ncbi:CAP domain-containing protein [Candidatus Marithrix sp. Canyon 246]|uniref:CAP domain-containing protein n=1 Tax=Candidatus Marithrix sp. Canyon 246 TaxID=1827136 RepID=UPI00084A18AE|nr:CAP domain-containing protein [Candidatus Marithrix sp. Canyon 246]
MKAYKLIISLLITFSAATAASQYDAELLRLTNLERKKVGLPALSLSSQLNQAAQSHADDMTKNNYFSHTGLNGSQPWDRAEAAGYNYSYVGENIAAGRSTPTETINQWMNSQGHRENILNSNYTEIGFGYSHLDSSKYRHYWVQVFGKSNGTNSTATTAPAITFENKSNIIFDLVEKVYAQYFFPATATQVSGSGNEIQYSRFYTNEYQAALTTKENNIWYGFYGEWHHFGTLDEANQQLCQNKCW